MKKTGLRTYAYLALIIALVMAMGGCSPSRPIKGTKDELAVVGQVGDFDVLYEELRYVTMNYKEQYKFLYGEDVWNNEDTAEQYRAELERQVLENITANYAVLTLCDEVGIGIDEKTIQDAVQDYIDEMVSELDGRDAYKSSLAKNFMSDHFLRFTLAVDYCYSELYYSYTYDLGLIEWEESVIYDYIMEGNFIRTLHVYIKNDPDDDIENNRKLASEVREQLWAGEDIKKVIGSSVNEDFGLTTTNGYYFTRGEMIKAYEEAAFALETGGVSEVVEADNGFYIIQRFELDPQYVSSNLTQLTENYQYSVLNNYIDEKQSELSIVLNDFGKSIDLIAIN